MTISDTLVPCTAMCEPEASKHVTALVAANQRWNHARYRIGETSPVERIGIVGAGYMGSVVAAAAVHHGVRVVITDQDAQALAVVEQAIQKAMQLEQRSSRNRVESELADFVSVTSSLADVASCDLVIESIVENLVIKRDLYADLGVLCRNEAILTSNTSTLPIAELSSGIADPQRFCGLHFFPPVGQRVMLEIIPGRETSDATTARMIQFAERLSRIPLVVADGRGFLVNRILLAYMSAGIRLLAAGVDIQSIESSALAFGMRMGPIRLYDEVGLDVALHCGWSMSADTDTLIVRSPTIIRMIKAKQLGRKSGRGFFIHDTAASGERVDDINPRALQVIESQIETRVDLSPAEIEAAITLPMVIEATKLLEIKRAHSAGQLDLAVMCGFGFPVSRGGPLWWADQVGAGRIVETLKLLRHLGPHLHPTQLLLDAAKHGLRFYDLENDDCGNGSAGSTSAVRNAS